MVKLWATWDFSVYPYYQRKSYKQVGNREIYAKNTASAVVWSSRIMGLYEEGSGFIWI